MWERIKTVISLALFLFILTITASVMYQRFVLEQPPQFLGYSWAIVLTGSMEPNIMTNDMIVIKRCDEYQVGDVISFKVDNPEYGGMPITHRIVEISEVEGRKTYITQGDANPVRDEDTIYYENILGKTVKVITITNKLITWIRTL